MILDLKNNRITIGELLDSPQSKAIIYKKIPIISKHPIQGAARSITLEQVISASEAFLPPKKIDEMLQLLRQA